MKCIRSEKKDILLTVNAIDFLLLLQYKSFYAYIYLNIISDPWAPYLCTGAQLEAVVDIVRRRSWPAITIEILEATLAPSNKMRIMYRANLNYKRFNRYFCDLVRKGFIEEKNGSDGRLVYKTTRRGRTLLEVLRKGQELFSSDGS